MSDNNETSLNGMLRNVNYDLRQNMIIGVSPPSLKYIFLTKIAIYLWTVQIKCSVVNFKTLEKTRRKILNLISNLMIPGTLKTDLKPVIILIEDEISNNLFMEGNFLFKNYNAKLKLFLTNLRWNQQGTINILKTAEAIIDNSNLSTLEQYQLACDFCMKDKIWDLQKILSNDERKSIKEDRSISMQKFWLIYVEKNTKNELTLINDSEAKRYLCSCFNISRNEHSLQYIWENLCDETFREQLYSYTSAILHLPNINKCNMAMYFLTEMNRVQLNIISITKHHFNALPKLNSISKWSSVLPIFNYAQEFMKTTDISKSFQIIGYCSLDNVLTEEEFISLWNKFLLKFNDQLQQKAAMLYKVALRWPCKLVNKLRIIKFIILLVSAEDRKKLIYSEITMDYCFHLLCNKNRDYGILFGLKTRPSVEGGLHYFDRFINFMLEENELHEFKEKFFQFGKIEICASYAVDLHCKLLDKILVKLCATESINDFKRKYCIDILQYILKSVVDYVKWFEMDILRVIEELLRWCFSSDSEKIRECKRLVFNLNSHVHSDIRSHFFIITKSYIASKKLELARNHFKWILSVNKVNVDTPNEKLALCKKIVFAMYEEINCLRWKYFGLFERFITSCFNEDEVKEIKSELQDYKNLLLLVKDLIERHNFKEVKSLLSWCFSDHEYKIAEFRIKFINSFGCSMMFHFIEHDLIGEEKYVVDAFRTYFELFFPTSESIKLFKKSFANFVANKKITEDSKDQKRDYLQEWKDSYVYDLFDLYCIEKEEVTDAAR